MPVVVKLTDTELELCQKLPDVLRAIAEHHASEETMADGMGYEHSAKFHESRRKELNAEADRIESEW